ncbi:mediator of RNA polymerase II transcription subunit 34 isoform X1, partial [Tanacetum coccineum]
PTEEILWIRGQGFECRLLPTPVSAPLGQDGSRELSELFLVGWIMTGSKKECHRSAFFKHFAEPLQDCNGMCDNCAFSCEVKEIDATGHAKAVVSLLQEIQEMDQRATMLQLVEKFKVKNKKVGFELKKAELEQLVIQLILNRVLKEEFSHTAYATNAYVTTGPLAKHVLHGKKNITLELTSGHKSGTSFAKSSKRSRYSGLEVELDNLRKELSSLQGGIFPHSIFNWKAPDEEQQDNNELSENEKEPETSVNRSSKRPKNKKVVVIESSEDDE